MKLQSILTFVPLLAAGMLACSGGGGGGNGGSGGGGGGGGSGTVLCMGTNIVAHEANDYSFSSTITLPVVKVAPNSNLLFDWSQVTANIIKHTVDPKKDLNNILVFLWDLNVTDLQTKLNADELDAKYMTTAPGLSYATDGNNTKANLLDFEFNGSPIGGPLVSVDTVMSYFDPTVYDPSNHIFTMMAASGIVLGQGTQMIQTFVLDPSSTNTTVTMTNASINLNFHADLTSLAPTGIPAGQPNIKLDWGHMTTNALGSDFSGISATRITSAFIGRYTQSPAELGGDNFLNLDLIATALYRANIDTGTSADFSTFTDASGAGFPGIDNTGTWLVGLQCGDCHNPAPWYITVLKPCS